MTVLLKTTQWSCISQLSGKIGLLAAFLLSYVGCTKSPPQVVTRDDGSKIVLPISEATSKSEMLSPEVSVEFFSGQWKSPSGQVQLSIDFAANTFSDRGEDWTRVVTIEESTAIPGGQVLLLHNPEHSDHPNGLWYALVLLKTSDNTILMVESPNLTTVLYRP